MSAPRILLVEDLDAAGATPADSRERVGALRDAGLVVRVMGLGGRGEMERDDDPRAAQPATFDLVLLASAVPGGGRAAPRLPRQVRALWWPTGFATAPGWLERFVSPGRARASLGDPRGRERATLHGFGPASEATDPALADLLWVTRETRQPPRPLPLWDGDYVLAPAGLRGPDAATTLAAFARVAAERSELDLVMLADPDPELERRAAGAGLAARVHCVGAATRDAEWAWWRQASAALIAGAAPCSAGLLLRGLDAGCPLVALDGSSAFGSRSRQAPGAGGWLASHRSAVAVAHDVEALAAGLVAALERGHAIEQVVARGRALAARHDAETLTRRLIARLAPELGGAWQAPRARARRPSADRAAITPGKAVA
jgi:hypothetical protein